MGWVIAVLGIALAIIAIGHAILGAVFVHRCRQHDIPLADRDCPRTAIILCLRGEDPTLTRCLEAVLRQDHPNYELMIVVDSKSDPAWKTAQRLANIEGDVTVTVRVLRERYSSCSLKCSAIVQAINDLEATSEFEAYVLLDQDVVPHDGWLRDLVSPLADRNVAAVSGFRWFLPQQLSFATILRTQWNAASVPLMHLNGICWGGSLALRTEFVHEARLLEKWTRAISDDTLIKIAAEEVGRKVQFLPALLMVNRGAAEFKTLLPWIFRQTYFGFLYNPSFKWRNRAATTAYNLVLGCSAAMGVVGLLNGHSSAWLLLGLLVAYWCMLISYHWRLDRIAFDKMGGNSSAMKRGPMWPMWMFFCLPISQFVSLLAVHASWGPKTIDWRGVRYRIRAPFDVTLETDQQAGPGTQSLPVHESDPTLSN